MNDLAERKLQVPALPSSARDLLAQRKTSMTKTLNDWVDDIHLELWEDDNYKKLLDAVYDEDATEGSLAADNLLAAMRIRDHAKETSKSYVADKKLATIVKALNVVLRRYGIDRRERRSMMGGEQIAGGNNE